MVSEPTIMATSSPSSSSTTSQTANITQLPILLPTISNISVKLDSTNYLLWKYQIISILEPYSLLDLLDGYVSPPSKFIADSGGIAIENLFYKEGKARDEALKTLINATLSPSAQVPLHTVFGKSWKEGALLSLALMC
jgi:hypothetical protein